jgi:hypothetical protein
MMLNFKDMIRILYFALKGFSLLYQRHKVYFTIESFMIGINDIGQIKVWYNRKFSEHFLKTSYTYPKVLKA